MWFIFFSSQTYTTYTKGTYINVVYILLFLEHTPHTLKVLGAGNVSQETADIGRNHLPSGGPQQCQHARSGGGRCDLW